MTFVEVVEAALKLGVIPAVALLLIFAQYLQNQKLIKDRARMERELLGMLKDVLRDQRAVLGLPPVAGMQSKDEEGDSR